MLPETPHEAAIAAEASLVTGSEPIPTEAQPETVAGEIDPEKHIVINGKVYERTAFTSEQVQAISLVNFADQQIASAQQNLHISKLGRDAMVKTLLEEIETVPSVGVVPPVEGE